MHLLESPLISTVAGYRGNDVKHYVFAQGGWNSSACFAHANIGWILYYVQGTLDYRQICVQNHASANK